MKILLIILCSIFMLQACTSKVVLKAEPSFDQKTYYDGAVISQKKHLVSLSPYTNFRLNKMAKGNTLFNMIVQNRGEDPIFISHNNVTVIFEGNSKDWDSKLIEVVPIPSAVTWESSLSLRASPDLNSIVKYNESFTIGKMEELTRQLGQLWDVIPKISLKPQTIMPDDGISVIFACDTRDMGPEIEGHFEIVVSIDDEYHEFTFTRSIEQ